MKLKDQICKNNGEKGFKELRLDMESIYTFQSDGLLMKFHEKTIFLSAHD